MNTIYMNFVLFNSYVVDRSHVVDWIKNISKTTLL
jgi:hypothetical protein